MNLSSPRTRSWLLLWACFLGGCYYWPMYDAYLITKPTPDQIKANEMYMRFQDAETFHDRYMYGIQYIKDQIRANQDSHI